MRNRFLTKEPQGRLMIPRPAVLGVMLCGLLADAAPGKPRTASPAQAIACPSYWPPESTSWELFRKAVPVASIAVINWHVTTAYTDAFVRDLQSTGLIVIAYVDTNYMAAGRAPVTEIVDRYYEAYPSLDGVFFDRTSSSWTSSSASYYTQLYVHAKSKPGKRIVVLNFGRQHDEPFMKICDISLNAETTWSEYRDRPELSASAWERSYPSNRFWHLIHGCPAGGLSAAIDKSKRNNAGYVFVTNVAPDPWSAIPDYWGREIEAVRQRPSSSPSYGFVVRTAENEEVRIAG